LKSFFPVLLCLIIALFFLTGCMPGIFTPEEDLPEDPALEMTANVEAVLVKVEEGQSSQVAWSIENTGDLFVREYKITFNVLYPMENKDNVLFDVVGFYLEIGEKVEGILDLVSYDVPETVSVKWELLE